MTEPSDHTTDTVEIPEPPAPVADVLERWHQALDSGADFVPHPGDPDVLQLRDLTAAHIGRPIEIHLVAEQAREVLSLGRFRVDRMRDGTDRYTHIAAARGAHVSVVADSDTWVLVYGC